MTKLVQCGCHTRVACWLVQFMQKMEQILCMVGKEAKNVLLDYQRDKGYKKQGEALEELLLKFKEPRLDMIELGVTFAIAASKGDGMISKDLQTDLVVSEIMRRYDDPMSDPVSMVEMTL